MPSLTDLKLNRFIKRDNSDIDTNDAGSSLYADIGDNQGSADTVGTSNGGSASTTSQNTNGVTPGTVVQSTIIQSSGSDNRIEIMPSDVFRAYRDGSVVVQIDRDGIDANQGTITQLSTDEFTYAGVPQPQVFGGSVSSAGAALYLPSGWTCVRNTTGDYTVTHNLNSPVWYSVVVTPITGHYRSKIVSFGPTTFNVTIQQTVYGSDTFPVVGGAGGNVTVDGVRVAPNEELVDSSFNFVLINYIF